MQALGKCCFRTEKAIILYNDQTDSLQLKQPMLQGGIRFLDIQVVPPRASSKRKSTAATAKTLPLHLGVGKLASEGFFPGRDNNGLFREDHKDISRGRNGVEILFYPFETKRK